MKKWNLLDTSLTPGGKTISLHEHDGTYAIRVDGEELMSTRRHASEEHAALLACEHAANTRAPRILIGGLGFGFTLKAALRTLKPDATVVVGELAPAVIAWNQNTAFPLASDALKDPRVTIVQGDVADLIPESKAAFDAIVMDVDNGPDALTSEANHRLYSATGLHQALTALRPQGCIAYWSAAPDPAFEKHMARAGFTVEVHRCRAHSTSGGWHTIFLGRNLKGDERRKPKSANQTTRP